MTLKGGEDADTKAATENVWSCSVSSPLGMQSLHTATAGYQELETGKYFWKELSKTAWQFGKKVNVTRFLG